MAEIRISRKQLEGTVEYINSYSSHNVSLEFVDKGIMVTFDGATDPKVYGNNTVNEFLNPFFLEALNNRTHDPAYLAMSGPCNPESFTKEYVKGYNKTHYDIITLKTIPAGMKGKIKARAEQKGLTVPKYIIGLIEADMAQA